MDVLRQHHAAATFFFVRRADGGPREGRARRRAAGLGGREPHVDATRRSWAMTAGRAWRRRSLTTQEEILRTTGIQNEFVRPRAGKYDDVALDVVRKMGLVMVGWDAYGHDTFNDGKTVARDRVVRGASRRRAARSSCSTRSTPRPSRRCPRILDRLESEGYELVTLSDLLSAR